MDRRSFLLSAAGFSLFQLTNQTFPWVASTKTENYWSTNGRIYARDARGRWQESLHVSTDWTLVQLIEDNETVFVKFANGSHSFWLQSSDGRAWRIV